MIKNPDFIIIPYQLVVNKNLQPNDRILYGVIYWLERLRDGKCTASNNHLASIIGCDTGSVKNSLNRLEEERFILRTYKDKSKKHRKEIISLIRFSVESSNDDTVSSNNDSVESSNDAQNNNIYNKNNKEYIATSVASKEIPRLIKKFETINPSVYKLYENKTQRKCLERLLEKHGAAKVEKFIDDAVKSFGKEYAPRITTPYALENKLGDLLSYKESEKNKRVPVKETAPQYKKWSMPKT